MSDHSWDDHDDDDHLAEPEGALDYFATDSGSDADPDDSGLDHLVTSDNETYDDETAGSYADAMEPETGGASDADETPDDDAALDDAAALRAHLARQVEADDAL